MLHLVYIRVDVQDFDLKHLSGPSAVPMILSPTATQCHARGIRVDPFGLPPDPLNAVPEWQAMSLG